MTISACRFLFVSDILFSIHEDLIQSFIHFQPTVSLASVPSLAQLSFTSGLVKYSCQTFFSISILHLNIQ
jgi:hypothetical protein